MSLPLLVPARVPVRVYHWIAVRIVEPFVFTRLYCVCQARTHCCSSHGVTRSRRVRFGAEDFSHSRLCHRAVTIHHVCGHAAVTSLVLKLFAICVTVKENPSNKQHIMVKVEIVEEKEVVNSPYGSPSSSRTNSTDSLSSIASDVSVEESFFDRVAALVDIVPPATRHSISSKISKTTSFIKKGGKVAGNIVWIVTTSALLVALPLALSLEDEAKIVAQEKEMLEQQQGAQQVRLSRLADASWCCIGPLFPSPFFLLTASCRCLRHLCTHRTPTNSNQKHSCRLAFRAFSCFNYDGLCLLNTRILHTPLLSSTAVWPSFIFSHFIALLRCQAMFGLTCSHHVDGRSTACVLCVCFRALSMYAIFLNIS